MSVVALMRDCGVAVATSMDIRIGPDGKLKGSGLSADARAFVSQNRAAVLELLAVDALALWTGEYVGSGFWKWVDEVYRSRPAETRRELWKIDDLVAKGDRAAVREFCEGLSKMESGSELMSTICAVFGVESPGEPEPVGGLNFNDL